MTTFRSSRRCSCCSRLLPIDQFPKAGGKVRPECLPCYADYQRMTAKPFTPIKRDPLQVQLNNLVCLWFGPARPHPRFTI